MNAKVALILLIMFMLSMSLVSSMTTISDTSIFTTGNITLMGMGTFQTLTIPGFDTGDVLSNEIDLVIGTEFGAMQIGRVQLFQSNLVIGGLDVNGTFITRHTGGSSDVRFAWIGADNLVRLAIPKEGPDFALYNPRSEMIGGDLGQLFNNNMINCSAQGYDKLDCDTNLTGADLGVQDDLQVRGALFVNETISVIGLESNYTNGEAYVCVYDNGTIFAKDTACS